MVGAPTKSDDRQQDSPLGTETTHNGKDMELQGEVATSFPEVSEASARTSDRSAGYDGVRHASALPLDQLPERFCGDHRPAADPDCLQGAGGISLHLVDGAPAKLEAWQASRME